jgi:prepilin-type N-terminal cleavage/methylation domain-containing protein
MMRCQRGMTLVEILVAAFVITIGLVAVATGMQLATAGVATGQQQTTASFLAEQRLEDIKSFAVSLNSAQGLANVTSTSFPADEAYGSITNYPSYRRTTTITTPTATTKRVTVSVFWFPVGVADQNAERSVVFSVLLASRS